MGLAAVKVKDHHRRTINAGKLPQREGVSPEKSSALHAEPVTMKVRERGPVG